MSRVIHFELPADDPARAIKFYEQVFAWKFEKWQGPMEYWLITTGPEGEPGIDGGAGAAHGSSHWDREHHRRK